MRFPAKVSKLKTSLLLLIVGVSLLSLVSITDAAKSRHTKQKSSHKGRSNRIDSSFEIEESTAVYPSSTTKKSTTSGKGKATYRGSRNQFFSKSKLTGLHGQVSTNTKSKQRRYDNEIFLNNKRMILNGH